LQYRRSITVGELLRRLLVLDMHPDAEVRIRREFVNAANGMREDHDWAVDRVVELDQTLGRRDSRNAAQLIIFTEENPEFEEVKSRP
jgi:hypothetical protein